MCTQPYLMGHGRNLGMRVKDHGSLRNQDHSYPITRFWSLRMERVFVLAKVGGWGNFRFPGQF